MGIIAASIPPLAPLVKVFRKEQGSSRSMSERRKELGSSYALQNIGGSKGMRGFVGIGSWDGGKRRREEVATFGDMETSQEELNKPRGREIRKQTEIVVSRHVGQEGRLFER